MFDFPPKQSVFACILSDIIFIDSNNCLQISKSFKDHIKSGKYIIMYKSNVIKQEIPNESIPACLVSTRSGFIILYDDGSICLIFKGTCIQYLKIVYQYIDKLHPIYLSSGCQYFTLMDSTNRLLYVQCEYNDLDAFNCIIVDNVQTYECFDDEIILIINGKIDMRLSANKYVNMDIIQNIDFTGNLEELDVMINDSINTNIELNDILLSDIQSISITHYSVMVILKSKSDCNNVLVFYNIYCISFPHIENYRMLYKLLQSTSKLHQIEKIIYNDGKVICILDNKKVVVFGDNEYNACMLSPNIDISTLDNKGYDINYCLHAYLEQLDDIQDVFLGYACLTSQGIILPNRLNEIWPKDIVDILECGELYACILNSSEIIFWKSNKDVDAGQIIADQEPNQRLYIKSNSIGSYI